MRLWKAQFLFPFLYFCLSLVQLAHCEGEVSLTNFPQDLATQLGVSLFAGQILASGIMLMMFLLPTLILTRNQLAPLFSGIVAMGITIALGWLPVYLLAILTLIIVVMFANKITRMIS